MCNNYISIMVLPKYRMHDFTYQALQYLVCKTEKLGVLLWKYSVWYLQAHHKNAVQPMRLPRGTAVAKTSPG